jgi:hypothetical protein
MKGSHVSHTGSWLRMTKKPLLSIQMEMAAMPTALALSCVRPVSIMRRKTDASSRSIAKMVSRKNR